MPDGEKALAETFFNPEKQGWLTKEGWGYGSKCTFNSTCSFLYTITCTVKWLWIDMYWSLQAMNILHFTIHWHLDYLDGSVSELLKVFKILSIVDDSCCNRPFQLRLGWMWCHIWFTRVRHLGARSCYCLWEMWPTLSSHNFRMVLYILIQWISVRISIFAEANSKIHPSSSYKLRKDGCY